MIPRPNDLVITRWGARFRGQSFPCAVGRGGLGKKSGEGDGITPKGRFQICGIGYRSDRQIAPKSLIPTQEIGPQAIWSDDPNDPAYNHGFTAFDHPYSHEKLRRPDRLYDMFAILDFNWPRATPGAGSAIFLHVWRKPRHPTEGCVAFSQNVFRDILESWSPDSRVIIR